MVSAGDGRRDPAGPSGPGRILIVEDQDDVRQMLVTALSLEGHDIDEAASASAGLKLLEEGQYNLVLSDYSMPGDTGSWMLREAIRRGIMHGADAIIITAHPDVEGPSGIEIITKPVELDRLLEQVRRLLAARAEPAGIGPTVDGTGGSVEPRVEFVLYVSSASPASIPALGNLERVLAKFDRTQVRFTVCDLGRHPLAGEADRIVFTPTLVKRFPEPRMWMLGNLRESRILADLLRAYGVDGSE